MTSDSVDRRKLLAAIGTGGLLLIGINLTEEDPNTQANAQRTPTPAGSETETPTTAADDTGTATETTAPTEVDTPTETGEPTQTEEPDEPETPTETNTDTSEPNQSDGGYDIRDFGAAVDGETDDSDAIIEAVDEAAPGGTVRFPAGDILIGADDDIGVELTQNHRDVTLSGAGPDQTRIVMAPDHGGVHRGIYINPDSLTSVGDLAFTDLTLDGQGLDQDYRVGLGIEVAESWTNQPISMRNVVVTNWATSGVKIRAPGAQIVQSTFSENGYKADEEGYDGHGVNCHLYGNRVGQVTADRVLSQGNTGAGFNTSGHLIIRNSVLDGCGYGIKQKQASLSLTVENTRIANMQTGFGIYNIPPDSEAGDLTLSNVLIENIPWPGISLPSNGSISGDNIVIKNTNNEADSRAGMLVYDEGREIDIGSISIHGTEGGAAVYLDGCAGSIDRLVQSDNDDGIGDFGDVGVTTLEIGDPLDITVPTKEQVGASSQ